MFTFVGKLILLFGLVVLAMRCMGKTVLAQLTPPDLAAIVFLITLSVSPLKVNGIGQAIVGIITIVVIYWLFSKLSLFRWLNRLFIGHPSILIKHGKISKKELLKTRFSLVELLSAIRAAGYPNIKDLDYVILEPNGDLSILPNQAVVNLTPRHLNIETDYQGLPLAMIVEGNLQHKNLRLIQKDENWLQEELAKKGFHQYNNIFYAAVSDKDHSIIIDTGN
ncbi:DUF421 domain-containing protein [Metabacillus sediminilitoris]|uniref:DUF421 domain-containing protein n=1 Tax=Metabacillus sediminilitoris TaxID=2567941 RepID=A0A4S4BX63_9BACI|nr:DUF421 domain-containing protein [Metabacillus sediminilitoris]QGQ46113.1 DUF421 domain-containing protein [Metabacillus sediminilitoris]THF79797.1 DUF421 domain-containing protein [Metabacillus sediminilitoris]